MYCNAFNIACECIETRQTTTTTRPFIPRFHRVLSTFLSLCSAVFYPYVAHLLTIRLSSPGPVSHSARLSLFIYFYFYAYIYLLFVPLNLHIRFNIIWRTIRIRNKLFALYFSHHVDALSYSYFLCSFLLQLQRAEYLTSTVQYHTARPDCGGHSETIFGFNSCTMLNIVRTKTGKKNGEENRVHDVLALEGRVWAVFVRCSWLRLQTAPSTAHLQWKTQFAYLQILKMKWKPTKSQIYCTFCQKRFAHLTDGVQSTPLSTFSHILHFWCWCSWHSTHYYFAYAGMAFHSISGTHWMNAVWTANSSIPRLFGFIPSILVKTGKKDVIF